MSVVSTFRGIIITLVLLVCLTSILSAEVSEEPIELDVKEIHQEMVDHKNDIFQNQLFYNKFIQQQPASRSQTSYDVLFYDIRKQLDEELGTIVGSNRVISLITEDGVNTIQMDYAERSGSNNIDSIVHSSGSLSYSWENWLIDITLDHTYNTGDTLEFVIYYNSLHSWEGGGVERRFVTWSEPYGAREWWPCKDRNDDKADSFKIAITVDTTYYCGSNGTLDSVINHGDSWHTFYYTEHYPMVTYLFSVAICNYVVWYDEWVYNNDLDTMPIVNAVFPDDYALSLVSYDKAPEMLTIFSDLFGLYPFADEKYGHALDDGGGAMEHQTMSTMGNSAYIFSWLVVAHEMGHQWWGDMITCHSWQDLWLNEGWASYCEALYQEQKNGQQAYLDHMTEQEYFNYNSVYVYDTTGGFFTLAQYDKGSWTLHQLRKVLGDSLFFESTRAFYNSVYQFNSATTDQFKVIYENISGMDLDWFFDQWVYGVGYPNYEWAYWAEPSSSGGTDVFLVVDQIQTTNPQLFIMPVDFRMRFDIYNFIDTTLWVDNRHSFFSMNINLDGVNSIDFDRENWLLEINNMVSWGPFRIITIEEQLSQGHQFQEYVDTIEFRGNISDPVFSISDGALPSGYSISSEGIISGSTADTGWFNFTAYLHKYALDDEVEFNLYVNPAEYICGDINNDGLGPFVDDLTYFVNYIFKGGPAPPIPSSGDMIADGQLLVNDIIYLVNYIFKGGPAPVC